MTGLQFNHITSIDNSWFEILSSGDNESLKRNVEREILYRGYMYLQYDPRSLLSKMRSLGRLSSMFETDDPWVDGQIMYATFPAPCA